MGRCHLFIGGFFHSPRLLRVHEWGRGGPGDRAGGLDPLSGACWGPGRQRAGTPPTPCAEWPEEVRGCGLAAQALKWAPRGELPAAELPLRPPCPTWAPASHVDPHGRPRAHPSSMPSTHLVPVVARLWAMPLLGSGFCFLQLENSFLFSGQLLFLVLMNNRHFPLTVLCVVHTITPY